LRRAPAGTGVQIFGWFLPLLGAPTAEAFTTRVHIALANEIDAALVASGDGSIPLRWSGATVQLSEADARAIVSQPLAFRAGAIGPDNFVFPAMTDQTHALGLRQYDQCADLIALAGSDAERAYALGCLLHGASDAVAHHWVNWLTGETFTLTPITTGRTTTYANVARHIVAESALQEAWMAESPTVFSQGALYHRPRTPSSGGPSYRPTARCGSGWPRTRWSNSRLSAPHTPTSP